MKKLLIIFCCLFLLVGCGKGEDKKVEEETKEEPFVLAKIDEKKDFVYFTDYKTVKLGTDDYVLKNLVVNIKGSAADNVNLELKSYVIKSYDEYQIYEGLLVQGKVIDYDYYVTDKYISIVQKYYMTVDTMRGDEDYHSYVISLTSGKTLDNNALLKEFNHTEQDIYDRLEKEIKDDDADYILARIKKDGFNLIVNDKDQLVVLYRVINDDESIIKKLVLN